jgi:predicted nucleic acid-binding protein
VIVYVETNFLLELAYLQERCDSCQLILDFAKAREITLALPSFSAAEARFALHRRTFERQQFQESLQKHIREISRSETFSGLDRQSKDIVAAFVSGSEETRERLEAAIEAVENHGILIPLTGEVIRMSRFHELTYSLKPEDALVLASIRSHAENNADRKCFISQDSKAFDNRAVFDELSGAGCKFISNFTDAVGYIRSALRAPIPPPQPPP